tara:strand:- start:4768 stop:4953 length:186 start_codon:yes stop_codon:yes gene_type:complete
MKFPYIDPKLVEQLEKLFPPLDLNLEDAEDPKLNLKVAHRAGARELILKLKGISEQQNRRQ